METYLLIVTFVILVGVMALVVLADKRRRVDVERFEKLQQVLAQCVQVLQAMQASQESHFSQLRTVVETAAKNQAGDTVRAVGEAAIKLQEAALQLQKTGGAEMESHGNKLAETVQAAAKQLSGELRKTTEAVEALKASLEESVKF
ncbi:MAG: hypothetical protein HYY24_12260 [Verrucomicrobia bacterium]|nr:hypothetical protein [Verrucomicrobiota bacterium]